MRRFVTYANIVSTLALILALSGTAYAAVVITGKDVRNGSLTGVDLKDASVRTADVKGLTRADFKAGTMLPGPGARIERSAAISIPPGSWTPDMDVEAYDTGNLTTPGSSVITIRRPGTYLVQGGLIWSGGAGDSRQVRILLNGAVRAVQVEVSDATILSQRVTDTLRVEHGDQISLGTLNGSIGSIPVSDFSGTNDVWLWVQYVG